MFCSIIIPTYNTDPRRLEALVSSLDAQSIAPDRFEVIFVDDGSSSDVVPRLEKIVATRPTYRLLASSNSGWPCKPRNDGTALARGDFVLYMDHDDVLFPEALERLDAFADANPSDVINPLEVRTNAWSWGWDGFAQDPEHPRHDVMRMLPMTPHKLYRRTFLAEHGISFYEDRRVLWEDVFFNVEVYAKRPRISVYTGYPVYHWVDTGENTSGTFGESVHEVWASIRALFEFFRQELEPDAAAALTEHWYRTRVLNRVGGKLLQWEDEERPEQEIAYARAVAAEFVPPTMDALLDPISRYRSALLRGGDADGLWDLVAQTRTYGVRQVSKGVGWSGDAVAFDSESRFFAADRQMEARVGADGHVRSTPDRSAPGTSTPSAQILDFGSTMSGSVRIALRGTENRESYSAGISIPLSLESAGDDIVHPIARGSVRIPVEMFVSDRSVPEQRWELGARTAGVGQTANGPLRTDETFEPMPALVGNRAFTLRRGASGALSIGVEKDAGPLLRSLESRILSASVEYRGRTARIVVGLPGVHVHDAVAFPGTILLRPMKGAVLDPTGVDIEMNAILDTNDAGPSACSDWSRLPDGDYRVLLLSGDRRLRIGRVTVAIPSPADRVRGLLTRKK